MNDSVIMCNEMIESCKEERNLNEKKKPVKRKISIFCLYFY